MTFNPTNFRSFTDESKPHFKIREATKSPLILIRQSGDAMYGRTRGEKDDVVRQFNPEQDLLLWAWSGEWSTDVFRLYAADIAEHYR